MKQNAIDYESSRIDLLEKSRRTSWIIAAVSVVVAVIAIITIFLLMPLKTVVPYVIKENVLTGETRIVTALDTKTLSTDEATDKFFASEYVKRREGYYYKQYGRF